MEENDYVGQIVTKGTFLRAKDLEQRSDGQVLMLPFNDEGVFWINIFEREGMILKINVNELLGIDDSTRTLFGFADPLINACFIDNEQIFVGLFHNTTLTFWQFIFNIP